MAFRGGKKASRLSVKGKVGKRKTGTLINITPDPQYFDSPKFSVSRLKHLLRAKAVLCPGLKVCFTDETASRKEQNSFEWYYEEGLKDYVFEIKLTTAGIAAFLMLMGYSIDTDILLRQVRKQQRLSKSILLCSTSSF